MWFQLKEEIIGKKERMLEESIFFSPDVGKGKLCDSTIVTGQQSPVPQEESAVWSSDD